MQRRDGGNHIGHLTAAILHHHQKEAMDQEGKARAKRRREEEEDDSEASDGILPLPHDVVATDILPRLPARSLARFRCVCKQWRSLTYDPRFAMDQSVRGADAGPRLCILPSNSFFASRSWYMLSNSVNGLFCALCIDDGTCHPYLFNPTTREVVPLPEISVGAHVMIESLTLSLGFDSSSGHYMVVLSYFIPLPVTAFYLLTVGSRDWRFLDELPCLLRPDPAVFHDATLYWEAPLPEEDTEAILAFDIKDWRFRFIRTPEIASARLLGHGKSKGHICLVHAHHGDDVLPFLRIYKLEDGTAPKCTRMYDIVMTGIVYDELQLHRWQPRVINEACGQILIRLGPRLYSYDEGSSTISLITDRRLPFGHHIDVFSPTLVSPSRLPALV